MIALLLPISSKATAIDSCKTGSTQKSIITMDENNNTCADNKLRL